MTNVRENTPDIDPEEILHGIVEWVNIESPSHDGVAVNVMADKVESDFKPLGMLVDRTPGRDGYGDILTLRTPWGGDGPGIL
ncbi:MAG: M20 family peptidase, partial [Chromatiales bacterium]|nr:M20 family peptidase [Chromatiales bacterium]